MRQIIKKPVISEKSFQKASLKKFTFLVDKKATKDEIKELIEKLYSVTVIKVNSANIKGKVKRIGRKIGKRDDQKKVVVTTNQKDTISIFEIEEDGKKDKKVDKKDIQKKESKKEDDKVKKDKDTTVTIKKAK